MTKLHGHITTNNPNGLRLALFDENKSILGSIELGDKFTITRLGGEWLISIYHANTTESNLFLATLELDAVPNNVKKVNEC